MKLSASLHAADPLCLGEAVEAVAPYVGSLHIDIMDGRFAPAFGFGENLVRRLVRQGRLPIDVHLMVEQPAPWAERFAAMAVRSVAYHVERTIDPAAVARLIRARGALAYLALQPDTPIASVARLLPEVDGLLLLTAPPGGGEFSLEALGRLRDIPAGVPVIVDGGLQADHLARAAMADVELAVVGKALFATRDIPSRARELARISGASRREA